MRPRPARRKLDGDAVREARRAYMRAHEAEVDALERAAEEFADAIGKESGVVALELVNAVLRRKGLKLKVWFDDQAAPGGARSRASR